MYYDLSPSPQTLSLQGMKSYLGENYGFFRIFDVVESDRRYISTFYANLPMAVFQYEDEAVGIVFEPVVDGIPLSVCVHSNGAATFEYRSGLKHLLKEKTKAWHGDWRNSTECVCHADPPQIEIRSAPNWMQLVKEYVAPMLGSEIGADDVTESLKKVSGFYNRAYDAGNSVHVDTLSCDAPGDLGDTIYTYPGFEACRLASLADLDRSRISRWEKIADVLLGDGVSVPLPELGDVRVWHNAGVLDEGSGDVSYTTAFGTGYSGWPGGMASTLRGLIRYVSATGRTAEHEKIAAGLNWFLNIQAEDGALPFNLPTFRDFNNATGRCRTGPGSRAVGGAGEAARALCAGYTLFGRKEYLEAAVKAARAVNPKPPHFAFCGYGDLRDAGDYETDATSGYSLGNANLDIYDITADKEHLEAALALGYYLLTWHFWWTPGPPEIVGLIDPVVKSFSPQASPWNTAMASEFYRRLYVATKDEFWRDASVFSYKQCIKYQHPQTGGISESYPMRLDGSCDTMGGESAMVSWALIDAGLAMGDSIEGFAYEGEDEGRRPSVEAEVSVSALIHAGDYLKRRPTLKKRSMELAKRAVKRLRKRLSASVILRLKEKARTVYEISDPSNRPVSGAEDVSLGAGDSGGGFVFASGSEGVYTLSSVTYSRRVFKVYWPVLTFPSKVVSFDAERRIGDTIISGAAKTEDGSLYNVEFLPGTDGLGASSVETDGNRLLFDATLRALWQRGGRRTLRISVTKGGAA